MLDRDVLGGSNIVIRDKKITYYFKLMMEHQTRLIEDRWRLRQLKLPSLLRSMKVHRRRSINGMKWLDFNFECQPSV